LTDYNEAPAGMYRIAKAARRILDLDKTLETHPGDALLFKERAAEYYRLGNYEQAADDYSSSLAIQPDDAPALQFRGLAYEQLGQSDRALEDYQQALAIDPQLSAVYINRGITLGKMGNFRQSLASLNEGIRLAPGNSDSYFNRGMTYFQLGDLERAIEDFSTVIQLSSNDEDAYYWRGISNEEAGRQREAIADYRQFLALSQSPEARGEIEQKLRRWKAGNRDRASGQEANLEGRQGANEVQPAQPDQALDLYDLILALRERAVNSIWLGSGVECYGEGAAELFSRTDQNLAIEGNDLLRITSGIRQTLAGDFQAFDPDATSPWIFIRAWQGSGFYIETNDPKIKERLKARFQSAEETEGVPPPYEGLFLRT
jgi:tetratricopeptide (TPR) repeat protein